MWSIKERNGHQERGELLFCFRVSLVCWDAPRARREDISCFLGIALRTCSKGVFSTSKKKKTLILVTHCDSNVCSPCDVETENDCWQNFQETSWGQERKNGSNLLCLSVGDTVGPIIVTSRRRCWTSDGLKVDSTNPKHSRWSEHVLTRGSLRGGRIPQWLSFEWLW